MAKHKENTTGMSISKPAVKRENLLLISGLMWSGVGLLLNFFALIWMHSFNISTMAAIVTAGISAGLMISFLGFNKIADKNIRRILTYENRVCVFAFQEWKSYLLIAVMMSMGIFLRSSRFVPRPYLASMYIGIGLALLISSIRYYRLFINSSSS